MYRERCCHLAEYFTDARKANGEEYEPDTLQMRKFSINRYLKSKGREYDLSDKHMFRLSKQTLVAKKKYRKVSNIRRTLIGSKIVDHSDVVGASPVGAAPTTSSFST